MEKLQGFEKASTTLTISSLTSATIHSLHITQGKPENQNLFTTKLEILILKEDAETLPEKDEVTTNHGLIKIHRGLPGTKNHTYSFLSYLLQKASGRRK